MHTIEKLPSIISIGRQGESGIQSIEIDVSEWLSQWPDGTISATYMAPKSEDVHMIPPDYIALAGNILTITVRHGLTEEDGVGTITVRITEGADTEKRSATFGVHIEKGHKSSYSSIPSIARDFVSHANEVFQSVEEAVSSANTAITNANTAITNLEGIAPLWSDVDISVSALGEGAAPTASITQDETGTSISLGIPKGDTGAQGIQGVKGDKGEKGDKGDGYKPKGQYLSNVQYEYLNVVTDGGSSYAYINPTPSADVPLTDTSHWQQIAEKGTKGDTGDVTPAAEAARDVAVASAAGMLMCDVDVDEAIASSNGTLCDITTYTSGVAQVETLTVAVTDVVTANPGGNVTVVVTAAGMAGSPVSVTVPVLLNDNADAIALAIRTALAADAAVGAFFDISGANNSIILTAKTAAKNDVSMKASLSTGTATGVTAVSASANTTKGSKNEIVHPSVLFFPNGWNGYKYWMGYTPYDNADYTTENPCIAVSNDNESWTTPPGLTNPIEPFPGGFSYNADINLFMSADFLTMHMVWKRVVDTKQTCLRSSSDGANWSERVVLFENNFEDVSPSVLWDGNQFKMWTLKHDDTPNTLYLRTAPNAEGPWSPPVACSASLPAGVEIWHLDVKRVGNQYHMLICNPGGFGDLYFGKSNDGLAWTFGTQPIFKSLETMYKPAIWPMVSGDGIRYALWYGTNSQNYIYKTQIEFNRSKKLSDCNNNVSQAINGTAPWVFCDTFNRPDTDAGLGTADSGQPWEVVFGGELGISGNKAYNPAAENRRRVIDLGMSDFYAEVTLPAIHATGSSYLLFRYSGLNDQWRFGASYGEITVCKNVSGALTTYRTNERITANDRLGVLCRGNNFTFFKNGIVIYKMTAADFNTATKIGLMSDNTVARFDNLIARTV